MIKYENFIESPYNDWQEIDVIVSRDCTLRCTYCYLQKNKDLIYDMDKVIERLDLLLAEAMENDKPGVVLSFYPEPWANIERANELIKRSIEVLIKYDRFVSNYMIMLGTNGVNLHREIPILKNLINHLSLGVTIDGIKKQHDMYRVFPDGSPSWDIVRKNILDNQEKYRIYGTKVTLGPDTIQYLYESSLFLWEEMGFMDINMNVAFEDLWEEKKLPRFLDLFEQQLSLLVDDIARNRRWEKSQYQSIVGYRHIPEHQAMYGYSGRNGMSARPYCGAGAMRSIDSDGEAYPCFRLSPYALSEDKRFNINNGETKRAIKLLNSVDSAVDKCRKCELFTSCSMCVGGAVEDSGSIYWRTTYHCEFQKLQNKYAKKLHQMMNGDT